MTARLSALAAALATTFALHCGIAAATPQGASPAQGIYVGEIGQGNAVLLTLDPAAGNALAGSYHPAQGWNQADTGLAGRADANGILHLAASQAGAKGKIVRTGRMEVRPNADGSALHGIWVSADGRRKLPVTLTRAAAWASQAVEAAGGVRTCERPHFSDARYERVNRELAEACDYFLADGAEGPGKLRLEIDSLGQYMVAAVAYASNRGQDLPPEVIAVDLGSEDVTPANPAPAHPRAIAWRP